MINLYTTSTIGNYKTGTVTCTKNSPTVTGAGTTWKEIVNPGDILTLDDDKFYIISAVNSNTSLTLDKNFAENTATNVSYRILLNTAAHFPSDTAAKVERALEQLSDINEAAINNDRTVTAATKVNGKGLSSTMGDIHLNPASVNTNRGGTINFHYNQNSSSTSSIYEYASGQIRVNGNLYLNGSLKNPITIDNTADQRQIKILNVSSANNANQRMICCAEDSNLDNKIGEIYFYTTQNSGSHQVMLRAYNAGVYADIGLNVDSNGNKTTNAPTPAASDNSSKIATTAFVNNRLPYTTGTWTPVLKGANTEGVFTYSTQVGYYLKIGSLVIIQAVIEVNNYTTHPVGRLSISGLPFGSAHGNYGFVIRGTGGLNNSFYKLCRCVTEHGYTSIYPQCIKANSNASEAGKIQDAYFSTSSQADGYVTFATPNNGAVIGSIKIFGVYATYY